MAGSSEIFSTFSRPKLDFIEHPQQIIRPNNFDKHSERGRARPCGKTRVMISAMNTPNRSIKWQPPSRQMRLKTIDNCFDYISGWHLYTFIRKSLWTLQKWTLYKSADCPWISITILCVSFTNSATVGRLEQVQLCNRLIDQSTDNITGLKCAKECLILKYKYIQNPWLYFTERILRWAHFLRSSKMWLSQNGLKWTEFWRKKKNTLQFGTWI